MLITRPPGIRNAQSAAVKRQCIWYGCMRMSCDERDEFLSKEILKTNPSLVERLTAPHKRYNSREIIAEMNNVIMNLDTENKILNDTVKWMHDTIWDLMHEKRAQARDEAAATDVGDEAADADVGD